MVAGDFHRELGPRHVRAPRKGSWTQCVCLLFDVAPKRSELVDALSGADILREIDAAPGRDGWALAGPSVLIDYRGDVNGLVTVDVVDRPWPDSMGSPAPEEAALFAAWATGHFGPCCYPGALERAIVHSYAWPDAEDIAPRHRAFVRVRSSYVLGLGEDALVLPDEYDAIDELRFVSDVQLALTDLRGCLCAFNPNGELLMSGERLEECLARDADGGAMAVDAWANVRMFRSDDGRWKIYDTVGMEQLDVSDHQAALPLDHPSTRHAPGLLHSMAAYDAARGGVLGPNDTASDLDGTLWRARASGDALVAPPRPVLCWAPDGVEPPAALSGRSSTGSR